MSGQRRRRWTSIKPALGTIFALEMQWFPLKNDLVTPGCPQRPSVSHCWRALRINHWTKSDPHIYTHWSNDVVATFNQCRSNVVCPVGIWTKRSRALLNDSGPLIIISNSQCQPILTTALTMKMHPPPSTHTHSSTVSL